MDTRLKLRHDTRVTLTIGNGVLKVLLNEEVIKTTNLSDIEDRILHTLVQRSNSSNPVSNRELDKICRDDYKLNIQFNTIKNNLASLRKKVRELLLIPQNIDLSTYALVDNRHGKGYLISDYWILERDEEVIDVCSENNVVSIPYLYFEVLKITIRRNAKKFLSLLFISLSIVLSLAFIQISYIIGNYEFYSSNSKMITYDLLKTENLCFKNDKVKRILSKSIVIDHIFISNHMNEVECRLSSLGVDRDLSNGKDIESQLIYDEYIVIDRSIDGYNLTYFYQKNRVNARYQSFNVIPSLVGFKFSYNKLPIVDSGSKGLDVFDWNEGDLTINFTLDLYNISLTSLVICLIYIFSFKYEYLKCFILVVYAVVGLRLKFEAVYNKSSNTKIEYIEILSSFKKFSPDKVIFSMNRIGFISRYTQYLLKRVPERGCFSINICPSMLMGKDGESFIHCISSYYNKNQIIIEITENSKITFCGVLKNRIEKLRELGFKIAIDDFGVGNNNLDLLKDLQADYVKIDKNFVLSILDSKNDKQYFCHLVRLLSATTDAKIIAEGVETQAHSNLLIDNDVYLQQGYYFT